MDKKKSVRFNSKKVFGIVAIFSFLCIAVAAYTMFAINAFAASDAEGEDDFEPKTVRVGYYNMNRFAYGAGDGQSKGGYGYEYLQDIACCNGWEYEYVYGRYNQLYAMLLSGDIDVLAGVPRTSDNESKLLFPTHSMGIRSETGYYYSGEADGETCYLAVSRERIDLWDDLNAAQDSIYEVNPYFLQNTIAKYYGDTVTTKVLSNSEQQWVNTHDTLRVGYVNNYMPYCGADDNGNAKGLMVDVFEAMISQLGLSDKVTVSYRKYESYDQLVTALNDGRIDAAFPVGGSLYNLEQDNIDATDPVVTTGMYLVYKGDFGSEKFNSIAAVRSNRLVHYYISTYYPKAEIVDYDTIEECVASVQSGKASSTIINGLRVNIISDNKQYDNLSLLQLENTDDRCIGVKSGNCGLNILLNRGLRIIGANYGTNASYNYMGELYLKTPSTILKNYLYEHLMVIIIVVSAVIFLIGILISGYINKSKLEKMYKQQAYLDGLTGIGNRLAYEEEVAKLMDADLDPSFVYLSLDINGLKVANDTLGHEAGDELISAAAKCIDDVFSRYGHIYRIGGDEFVALITIGGTSLDDIIKEFNNVVRLWKGKICSELKVSSGYATKREFPKKYISELAVVADERMYESKEAYYKENGSRR